MTAGKKNWDQIADEEFNAMDAEGRAQWSELRMIVDHQ